MRVPIGRVFDSSFILRIVISGVPGTGKTATVYSALRSLSEDEVRTSLLCVTSNHSN